MSEQTFTAPTENEVREYVTRDGRSARAYRSRGKLFGEIDGTPTTWFSSGFYRPFSQQSASDIIDDPKTLDIEIWIHVLDDGRILSYADEPLFVPSNVVASVHHELKVAEGFHGKY